MISLNPHSSSVMSAADASTKDDDDDDERPLLARARQEPSTPPRADSPSEDENHDNRDPSGSNAVPERRLSYYESPSAEKRKRLLDLAESRRKRPR